MDRVGPTTSLIHSFTFISFNDERYQVFGRFSGLRSVPGAHIFNEIPAPGALGGVDEAVDEAVDAGACCCTDGDCGGGEAGV